MSNDRESRDGNAQADGEYTDADPIEKKAPRPDDEGSYTDSELPDDAE